MVRKREIKITKRMTKQSVFQERTVKNVPVIVNTPLDKDGHPERHLEEIELRGKVFRGYHRLIKVILVDKWGNPYLREVLE